MTNNKITFWEYLHRNKVVIPIIQRDYAQGRSDKSALRKNFLASLKQALDGKLPNGQRELKLDFIYGSVEHNVLLPLDGQQRITTLWLMHWYIALKAGKLAEAGERLSRFTYETRRSSREFCNQMCNPENFADIDENTDLYGYVTNQTWFSSSWFQDPTITSMLRMISGTMIDVKKLDKKKQNEAKIANAVVDGLEKIFKGTTSDKFNLYWNSLISDNPPFYFYQLPLHEFGLTDDLYVKMNARGKQLTPFENFKADLIGYIRQRAREKEEGKDLNKPDSDKDWASLLDPRKGIPIKLDTEWTDIFWKFRSKNNTIDEIFFSFMNRVFWEEFISLRRPYANENDENDEISVKDLEENESYRFLTADDITDYHDLAPYRFYKNEIPFTLFENLSIVLDRLKEIGNMPGMPRNVGDQFFFIPVYLSDPKKSESISKLTQPHRVIFHAVYRYLLEGAFDEISFKRWMRVVCNLTSGKSLGGEWDRYIIRTTATMLSAISIVSGLDSHKVYESLKLKVPQKSKKEIPSRLLEEIVKAHQILDGHGNIRVYGYSGDPNSEIEFETWEDAIICAENYSCFNGSIVFLFRDADGEVDWNDFDDKFSAVRRYFKKEVSENGSSDILKPDYKDSASLLKALISRFSNDNFWKVIWWRKHYLFNNSEMSWRHYLYNDEITKPIHEFLMEGATIVTMEDSSDRAQHMLYLLSNTGLLDYAIKKFNNSYIRTYHGHDAIYPSATGVFLDVPVRDVFLQRDDMEILNGEFVPGSNLIYGTNIKFAYGANIYCWCSDNNIYLMDSDNSDEYATVSINGEDKNIFVDTGGKDVAGLIEELKKLPEIYGEFCLNSNRHSST